MKTRRVGHLWQDSDSKEDLKHGKLDKDKTRYTTHDCRITNRNLPQIPKTNVGDVPDSKFRITSGVWHIIYSRTRVIAHAREPTQSMQLCGLCNYTGSALRQYKCHCCVEGCIFNVVFAF